MWEPGSCATTTWPRSVAIIAVAVLMVAYLPQAGLDRLHLHDGPAHDLVHDHAHVGHHEHDGHGNGRDRDDGEHRRDTTVLSFTHGVHVRPAPVVIPVIASTVGPRRATPSSQLPHAADEHPSRSPRAPPV
jgi:hypothetical protein